MPEIVRYRCSATNRTAIIVYEKRANECVFLCIGSLTDSNTSDSDMEGILSTISRHARVNIQNIQFYELRTHLAERNHSYRVYPYKIQPFYVQITGNGMRVVDGKQMNCPVEVLQIFDGYIGWEEPPLQTVDMFSALVGGFRPISARTTFHLDNLSNNISHHNEFQKDRRLQIVVDCGDMSAHPFARHAPRYVAFQKPVAHCR